MTIDRRTLIRSSLTVGAGAVVAACGAPSVSRPSASQVPASLQTDDGRGASKVLLAYFSRPGENYHYGGRIHLDTGNTEVLADMIAAEVAVDVYRILAADPYPESYQATVERNRDEQGAEARPAIADPIPAVTSYDAVLLGSPIWSSSPPMIMRTFLDNADLRGKTIHPFVTFAVSGMGTTVEDYTRLCPDATMGEGLAVRGEEVRAAGPQVSAWLERTQISA